MPKRYWYAVLTYVLMHASGIIALPIMLILMPITQYEAIVYWSLFSFFIALIIILQLLRPDMTMRRSPEAADSVQVILWSIVGVFMAYFAQIISVLIETEVFGIEVGSENTNMIMDFTRQIPVFLIIPAIVAPILEEIVFRKIIFGALYSRMNFFWAALLSSFIFGIIHGEPQHILIYGSMGFVFAFLYVRTKRIIVPIIVHAGMNSITVLVQLSLDPEDIERMQRQLEEMLIFIGG